MLPTKDILTFVSGAALSQLPYIKNRGRLNANFTYFEVSEGNFVPVNGRDTILSETTFTKYVAVAADTLVFSADLEHILMIFRCPHAEDQPHSASDKGTLDTESFQYKGCLATPGGFFNPETDFMEDNTPDFQKTAMREFREECSARLGVLNFDSDMVFIGAECNSFRDVRWAKANNYVPTVAAIFASALKDPGLPQVRGRDDACGNAYWVPLKVIERVYRQHKGVFGLFNEPFTPEAFSGFIQDTSMFHLDQEDHPRNILKIENSILANVKSNEFVIHYNERTHYRASDFAFDHVKNIVRARDMMRYKERSAKRSNIATDSSPDAAQKMVDHVNDLFRLSSKYNDSVVFHTLWDAVEPPVDVKFPQKHLPNNSTDVTYKHEGSQLADQIFILAASCANDRVFVALLRAKFVPPTQAKEANPDFIATYGGILF